MFKTDALTYQDILAMPVDERIELEEARYLYETEWFPPPPPKCPLLK